MKHFKLLNFVIVFIFLGFFTQNVQAQFSAGVGLSYGSEVEELGLNLRVQYDVTEKINANANLTYWFVGEGGTISTFNIDGHYYLLSEEKYNVYALAGLNFFRVKTDELDLGLLGTIPAGKVTETGLNVGAGIDFGLTEAIGAFAEIKYVISDADQLVITAGAKYAF